jgi:hypothetical protein
MSASKRSLEDAEDIPGSKVPKLQQQQPYTYGPPELIDCRLIGNNDIAIECSLSILVANASFFEAWLRFPREEPDLPFKYEIQLPQEVTEYAALFLVKTFYETDALPVGCTDLELCNIIVAVDVLQVKNPFWKARLSACVPPALYTYPVIMAASQHGFPRLLRKAFTKTCLAANLGLPTAHLVLNAFLSNEFELLGKLQHEGLRFLITGLRDDNEVSQKVANKIAQDIKHHPQYHTLRMLRASSNVPVIKNALLALEPPRYLQVTSKIDIEIGCFSHGTKNKLIMMYYRNAVSQSKSEP